MAEKPIKQITVRLPNPDTFLLAFPSPTKNLIDISGIPTEYLICDDGQEIPVMRLDYWRYPINRMSNFMCQLAYGENKEWVKKYLMETYDTLTETSYVAFFLFKILPKK